MSSFTLKEFASLSGTDLECRGDENIHFFSYLALQRLTHTL